MHMYTSTYLNIHVHIHFLHCLHDFNLRSTLVFFQHSIYVLFFLLLICSPNFLCLFLKQLLSILNIHPYSSIISGGITYNEDPKMMTLLSKITGKSQCLFCFGVDFPFNVVRWCLYFSKFTKYRNVLLPSQTRFAAANSVSSPSIVLSLSHFLTCWHFFSHMHARTHKL